MWKKDRQRIIAYRMTFKSVGSLYDKRLKVAEL